MSEPSTLSKYVIVQTKIFTFNQMIFIQIHVNSRLKDRTMVDDRILTFRFFCKYMQLNPYRYLEEID